RFEAQDGYKGVPEYSGSSATGGFPGLCLDNADVRARAETFLKAMATRYKNHPALYGYDLCSTLAIRPHGTEHKSRTPAELGEVFPHALGGGTGENPSASSTADAPP